MKFELITQLATIALLGVMIHLQIRNFVRYSKSNGANTTRIIVASSTLFSFIHAILLIFGYSHGYFFSAAVVCFSLIYLRSPQ